MADPLAAVTWAASQGSGFAAINGDRTHARTGTSLHSQSTAYAIVRERQPEVEKSRSDDTGAASSNVRRSMMRRSRACLG